MDKQRKKPGLAYSTTVVILALPILYIASFGPAYWLQSRMPTRQFTFYHRPLWDMVTRGNGVIAHSLLWYANVGTRHHRIWLRHPQGDLYLEQHGLK